MAIDKHGDDYFVRLSTEVRDQQLMPRLRKYGGAVYAVWMCLGLHVGKDGTCNPSLATIARETGYCRATVQKAIDGLVAEGFVTKWPQRNKKGDPTSNLYYLHKWWWFGTAPE